MNTTHTSAQLEDLLRLFREKGMTPERWGEIASSGAFADLCDPSAYHTDRDAWQRLLGLNTFRLTVEAGASFSAMVAEGNYDWVSRDITPERFPIVEDDIGEFEARYFRHTIHFSPSSETDIIRREDLRNPWEPARIAHLLALGKKFPDEPRELMVVAAGSVAQVDGSDDTVVLRKEKRSDEKRGLDLIRPVVGWGYRGRHRFLAVRRISGT